MKHLIILACLLGLNAPVWSKTLTMSSAESKVSWVGKKVTGQHNGQIKMKSGQLEVNEKGVLTGGNVEIDMATITCEDLTSAEYNQKLLEHMKSDDFFDVQKYPTSKFVMKSAKKGAGDKYDIKGDLTIKGKTHPIKFKADVKTQEGATLVNAKLPIDRTRWDIRYGSGKFFKSLGDKMIHDEFEIEFQVKAQ